MPRLLKYILMMTILLVVNSAARANYVIDKVCKDAVRTYRVDGEPGLTYTWILKDDSGTQVLVSAGSVFADTDSGGNLVEGGEIKINWSFDPGIYTLMIEKQSQFNCKTDTAGIIEVLPKPFVDAGKPQTICAGSVVSLSDAAAINITPGGMEWTTSGDGSFDNPDSANPNYTPGANDLLAGKVTLKLTANSMGEKDGCVQEDEVEIMIFSKPKLVITDPGAVCEPDWADLTAASVTDGSTIPTGVIPSYWTDAAATVSLPNPGRVVKSGTYYIKLESNAACQDIKPVKVIVNAQPKLVITNPPAVCEPVTVDISASYITAGSDPGLSLSYWTDGSASSSLANYQAISVGGTYYIKADNGTTCPNIQQVTVTINIPATPQFSLNNLLCQNTTPPILPTTSNDGIKGVWSPVVVSTSVVGTIPYVFTPESGECAKPTTIEFTITDEIKPLFAAIGPFCVGKIPPQLPLTSTNNITGTWSPTQISTATAGPSDYTFTPNGGCSNPIILSVTITDPATPSFAPIAPICQNSANPLPATSIEGISGTWSPAFSSATVGPTPYTFTPNAGQCANTAPVTVTVNPSVPVTFDQLGPFCAGDPKPTLPTISKEGISGKWNPTVVDMTQTRAYAFTPDAGCTNPFSMTIVINQLGVVVSVTPISKSNPLGSIDLTVAGGSGSYIYSWTGPNGFASSDKNLTGLAAGNYAVLVTDKVSGCQAPATAVLYILDELTVLISSTEITCPGGSDGTATATISGGTPPYSIQWKNSPVPEIVNSNIVTINDLIADLYFYARVVDATGKSVSSPFEAIKESSIRYTIASAAATDPVCFGEDGKIELTFGNSGIVPNGNHDILYDGGQFTAVEILGNRGTISAPTGIYNNLKVKIRGCITNAVGPFTITPAQALELPVIVLVQPDCDVPSETIKIITPAPASGITYTVTGTNPVVAVKTNTTGVFAGLTPGTYDISYTDAKGCDSSPVTYTIDVRTIPLPAPVASVTIQPDCFIATGTIVVTNPAFNTGYEYSLDGISYQDQTIFTGLLPGLYNLRVRTKLNKCDSEITKLTVDQPIAPANPTAIPLPAECETSPVQELNANNGIVPPPSGILIKWFESLTGGIEITLPIWNKTGSKTYYAEAHNGFCTSPGRTPVTLTIIAMPVAPVSSGNLMACAGTPQVTLDARKAITGGNKNLIWYDSPVGGNVVASPTLNTVNTITYYVVESNGICTSAPRTAVKLTIFPLPAKPNLVMAAEIKCSDTFGQIEVKSPLGTEYVYRMDNGTYQPSVLFNASPGSHFIRVRNTITLCESDTTVIKVPAIPLVPKIKSIVTDNCICFGDSGRMSFDFENVADGNYVIIYLGGRFENVKVVKGKAQFKAVAGNYNVLAIEANGCTSNENWNVTIKQPDRISVSAVITEIDLKSQTKGAIDLTISGGIGNYLTVWQPNAAIQFAGALTKDIKNLNDGQYVVTITDQNGCQYLDTLIIPLPNMPPTATNDEFFAGCGGVAGDIIYSDNGFGKDFDLDGDTLFVDFKLIENPKHGTLILDPDQSGKFTYVADQGYTGIDQFQYVVFDVKKNFSNPARVVIHVVSDFDCDGIQDDLDPDADADGILNVDEGTLTTDSDGDGHLNWLDIDADNDGIVDNFEGQGTAGYIAPSGLDTDHDGIDDAYDTDHGGVKLVPVDTDSAFADGDGIPDFLDVDSDNDWVPDYIEGHDADADGKPDFILRGKDVDADGLDDGFDTVNRYTSQDINMAGTNAAMQDTDADGQKDWRDENDDDDKYLTRFEDLNVDGNYSNDDTDSDGHPEYLDFGRDCDLFVPEAFSPNDDNIHDYFQIYCIDHFPNAKMYIFDQLGNKLYEKDHYGNIEWHGSVERALWDGTTSNRAASVNGRKVIQGTYYYVLQLGNGEVKKSFVFVSY